MKQRPEDALQSFYDDCKTALPERVQSPWRSAVVVALGPVAVMLMLAIVAGTPSKSQQPGLDKWILDREERMIGEIHPLPSTRHSEERSTNCNV